MKHFSSSDGQLTSDLAEIRRIQREMDAALHRLSLFETFADEFRGFLENECFILAQAMGASRKSTVERPLTETEREVQEAIQRIADVK